MRTYITILLIVFGGILLHSQADDTTLENLAVQIAQKRSELESLTNELDLLKTEFNEEMRTIGTQRADIEARIKREEISLKSIENDLQEYEEGIRKNSMRMDDLRPVLIQISGKVREYIENSLPFQKQGRLSELDTLDRLLGNNRLREVDMLARLWNILEAESRLTRESGLYQQTIELNGESRLAEVARVGMVFLYFRTLDGTYGYVTRNNGIWEFLKVSSREEQKQIENLFDSFRKNLREGYFELPNPGIELTGEQL